MSKAEIVSRSMDQRLMWLEMSAGTCDVLLLGVKLMSLSSLFLQGTPGPGWRQRGVQG